jgi:hypothetical protein
MASKKNTDFALVEIDVQYYKKQGYIKLSSCLVCHALVIETAKAEHAAMLGKIMKKMFPSGRGFSE